MFKSTNQLYALSMAQSSGMVGETASVEASTHLRGHEHAML
jgi:hypothetical protein